MKKDLVIIAGAALAAWWLLARQQQAKQPELYWVSAQGNTAYPAEMQTQTKVFI